MLLHREIISIHSEQAKQLNVPLSLASSSHSTESYLGFLERSAERGHRERETIARAIGATVPMGWLLMTVEASDSDFRLANQANIQASTLGGPQGQS